MRHLRRVTTVAACALIAVLATPLPALDLGLHMAASKGAVYQLFGQNRLDYGFYQTITDPNPPDTGKPRQMLARKFYYIGATLPDMLTQQSTIAELCATLYQNRLLFWHLGSVDPLYITDETKRQTESRIVFPDVHAEHDAKALRRMVDLVRNDTCITAKALVYGAYAHAVEDNYGHMALQPSLFGYDISVEPPGAATGLFDSCMSELYHEIFSGGNISYSNYNENSEYAQIDDALFCGLSKTWDHGEFRRPTLLPLTLEFYREEYHGDVQMDPRAWQQFDLPALRRFAVLARAAGYVSRTDTSLTHDRLRAYLNGWAIILGLMYGTDGDGYGAGGILGQGMRGQVFRACCPNLFLTSCTICV